MELLFFLSLLGKKIISWMLSIFVLPTKQRSQLLLGFERVLPNSWSFLNTDLLVANPCPAHGLMYGFLLKIVKKQEVKTLKTNESKPIMYSMCHHATKTLLSPSYFFTQVRLLLFSWINIKENTLAKKKNETKMLWRNPTKVDAHFLTSHLTIIYSPPSCPCN